MDIETGDHNCKLAPGGNNWTKCYLSFPRPWVPNCLKAWTRQAGLGLKLSMQYWNLEKDGDGEESGLVTNHE